MENVKRSAFWFYRSYYESLKSLPYDMKGRLFDAIAEFMLDGIEPNFDGMERFAWEVLKPNLYLNRKRAECGSKGGRKRTENENRKSSNSQATFKQLSSKHDFASSKL